MKTDYKKIALEMNRLYCGGDGHKASELLAKAIRDDDTQETDYTDYLLFHLAELQKQISTLTEEIQKWKQK